MLLKIFIPFLFTLLHGCSKNDLAVKPAAVLLTQQSWILSSHGIDHNQNDRIEPSEENIQDCEKDNLYHFFMNGSGHWEENSLQCGTGVSEMPFNWKLINHDTEIDFTVSVAKILILAESEFAIYHEIDQVNGKPLKQITFFRR